MSEDKKEKKKSFMDVYREVNERERAEELRKESEAAAAAAEKERKARNDYADKLRQDRLELLKLKQGVIEEIPQEAKVERQYTIWEKIGNFFYHNSIMIILGTLFAALAIFLIYDLVTVTHPDVAVMIIAEDEYFDFVTEDMRKVFERYCEDYNGDGKVFVRVSYLPVNYTGNVLHDSDRVKLMGEFQGEDSIVVIADRESCETFGILEGVLADLSEFYPGDENVNELGYMLSGTSLAADVVYDDMADNLFVGFRKPQSGAGLNEEKFRKNFDNAVEMWTNYLTGNEVNPSDEDQ